MRGPRSPIRRGLPLPFATGRRRGFALAAALLATILIAALLASLFFAVTEETRTEAAIDRRDRALAAAESALETGLEGLSIWPLDSLIVGTAQTHFVDAEGLPGAVTLTRLDSALFWLVAVVGDPGAPAAITRRIGILAEVTRPSADSIRIVRVTERGWSELF